MKVGSSCRGFHVAFVFVVFAVSGSSGGCSGDKSPSNPKATDSKSDEQKSVAKPSSSVSSPGKNAGETAVANAKLKEQCETSCLLLTEYSLDELGGNGYCKMCGGYVDDACSAPNPFAADNCDQFDYQRNCVFAASGYTFRKKRWQTRFGKMSWYKGSNDFKHSDLSTVAKANIKALRDRTSVCRGQGDGPVSPKDMEVVRRFLNKKKLKQGKGALPAKLYVDGQFASRKEFLDFFMTDGLFTLKRYTPVRYQDWGPHGEIDKSKYRSIHVPTGAPGPSCNEAEGECEGFEWLDLVLDSKGHVVEAGLGAAACPFVYVSSDVSSGVSSDVSSGVANGEGRWSFAGEILRNRNRRDLESTQHLTLKASIPANQLLRVRIAEEKQERTYLDAVSLIVGGLEVHPVRCGADKNRPRFCDDDGVYLVLEPGLAIDLEFDLSSVPHPTRAFLKLRANGFYTPL